jgi:hypothetical protein
MRLYRNQISKLADAIIRVLIEENEIVEIAQRPEPTEDEERRATTWSTRGRRFDAQDELPDDLLPEFRQDIRAVLNSYVHTDKRLTEEARKIVESRGDDPSMIYSEKRRLAKHENFGLNEDAPSYIVGQLIEALLHTESVEEVYAEDKEIHQLLQPEVREVMSNQRNLQQEVEQRIRNLERGSQTWEDQFYQVSQRLKERYQLD